MFVDAAPNHNPLQEVDELLALLGGPVLPVVATVDADDGVDGCVGALGQVDLQFGIIGGQTGQRGEVPTGRTTGDRDEFAVTAELVDIRPRPRDGGLHVGDVLRPAVIRGHAVIDGQTDPALLGQVAHQGVAL
ncbi:hypothetical protein MAUB1S_01968 [Mycolicibacterium aubagnense]